MVLLHMRLIHHARHAKNHFGIPFIRRQSFDILTAERTIRLEHVACQIDDVRPFFYCRSGLLYRVDMHRNLRNRRARRSRFA